MTGTLVHASNSAQYALGVAIDNVARLLHIDETVLWSGNLNQPSAISLSEKSNNFTTIKMYLNDQNGWKEIKEYNADQWQFGLTLTTPYASNRNSSIIRYGILSSTNYIDYTYTAVGRALLTTATNNFAVLDNSGPFIEKIIGIGRK